jgi:hypothetical protein
MKSNTFNYSLLAVGVATVMGISSGANAAEATAVSKNAIPITNIATANYSVGTVLQPEVRSNPVVVNISETANFSLVATSDNDTNIDANSDRPAVPDNTTTTEFNHTLSNIGNVADTYTINTNAVNVAAINTPNATNPVGVGSENYLFGNKPVSFTIVPVDGNNATAAEQTAALQAIGQVASGTVTNGQTIKLPPGYKANLTYSTVTPIAQLGGDVGIGTLTATSNYKGTARVLTNENQTLVKLPVFKIEKSATCGPTNTNCTTLDLNSATPTITYSIKVTNVNTTYSDTATNFIVRDVLPAGMTITAANATAAGVTTTTANNITTLSKTIASLAPGASETITFTVSVNKASYTGSNSSATNNATVYDRFDATLPAPDNATNGYDIVDSTDTVPANNVTRLKPAIDGAGGVGVDTTTAISFTNRSVALDTVTTRQIAPISGTAGQVTHQTVITNNGQDAEGTATNPLTFTITDGGTNDKVAPVGGPVEIVYTPTVGGASQTFTLPPTVDGGSTYTINGTVLTNGIAPGGGKVAINYKVASTSSSDVNEPTTIGTTETTIVKLTAIGGNGAPNVADIPAVTDTTRVEGLTLDKFQALDKNCNGTIDSGDIDFTKNVINAEPSQCVIYRIDAKNTSATTTNPVSQGFNITGLTISDAKSRFSTSADYVTGSGKIKVGTANETNATDGTPSFSGAVPSIYGSVATLVPSQSASLTFRVKIKNTGLQAAP